MAGNTVDANRQAALEAARRQAAERAARAAAERQRLQQAAASQAAQGSGSADAAERNAAAARTAPIDRDTFVQQAQIEGLDETQRGELFDRFDNDGETGLSDAEFDAAFAEATGNQVENMRTGAEGQEVSDIQTQLAAAGADPGPIDGQYGPQTAGAVSAYQESRGLAVDGVAGPQTRSALMIESASIDPERPQLQSADRQDEATTAARGEDQAVLDNARAALQNLPPEARPAFEAKVTELQTAFDTKWVAGPAADTINAGGQPPKPGDTVNPDGTINETEVQNLQDEGQRLTDALAQIPADHPDRAALEQKVNDFNAGLEQTLSGQQAIADAVVAGNEAGAVTKDQLNDMNPEELAAHYEKLAGAANALADAPELQQAVMGKAEEQLSNLTDGEISDNDREILNAIVDSDMPLEGFSQDMRQNLLRTAASQHDSNFTDDQRGPSERLQEVMNSLLNDPNLDKGALEANIREFAHGDSQNRLIDFATEEQLAQLSPELLTSLKEGNDGDNGKNDKLDRAITAAQAAQTPEAQAASAVSSLLAQDPNTVDVNQFQTQIDGLTEHFANLTPEAQAQALDYVRTVTGNFSNNIDGERILVDTGFVANLPPADQQAVLNTLTNGPSGDDIKNSEGPSAEDAGRAQVVQELLTPTAPAAEPEQRRTSGPQ